MPKNTSNLPYFKIRGKTEEKTLADYLLRKFRPRIKEKFPQHFLVQPIPFKTLNFIKETFKKYPHFLRFDIRLYYPSVSHQILLKKLPEIYPVRWRLRLSHGVNEKKLKSGKFHQDRMNFIGFDFYPVRYSFNLFLIYLLPQAVFRYFSLFVASC